MEQGKGKGLADVKGKAQLTPPFPPRKASAPRRVSQAQTGTVPVLGLRVC